MTASKMCPYDKRCELVDIGGEYDQCNYHGCRYSKDGKYMPYNKQNREEKQ